MSNPIRIEEKSNSLLLCFNLTGEDANPDKLLEPFDSFAIHGLLETLREIKGNPNFSCNVGYQFISDFITKKIQERYSRHGANPQTLKWVANSFLEKMEGRQATPQTILQNVIDFSEYIHCYIHYGSGSFQTKTPLLESFSEEVAKDFIKAYRLTQNISEWTQKAEDILSLICTKKASAEELKKLQEGTPPLNSPFYHGEFIVPVQNITTKDSFWPAEKDRITVAKTFLSFWMLYNPEYFKEKDALEKIQRLVCGTTSKESADFIKEHTSILYKKNKIQEVVLTLELKPYLPHHTEEEVSHIAERIIDRITKTPFGLEYKKKKVLIDTRLREISRNLQSSPELTLAYLMSEDEKLSNIETMAMRYQEQAEEWRFGPKRLINRRELCSNVSRIFEHLAFIQNEVAEKTLDNIVYPPSQYKKFSVGCHSKMNL